MLKYIGRFETLTSNYILLEDKDYKSDYKKLEVKLCLLIASKGNCYIPPKVVSILSRYTRSSSVR